jgi:hypothetical protein
MIEINKDNRRLYLNELNVLQLHPYYFVEIPIEDKVHFSLKYAIIE